MKYVKLRFFVYDYFYCTEMRISRLIVDIEDNRQSVYGSGSFI